MNQWIIILPLFLGLLFVNFDVEHYYPSVSRNLHPISKIGNIGNIRNYPLNYNTGKKNTFSRGKGHACLKKYKRAAMMWHNLRTSRCI